VGQLGTPNLFLFKYLCSYMVLIRIQF
jgi:hypothetical protein